MAVVTGVFLIRIPSITTMMIMMLTTLATMSRKESEFTASVSCVFGRDMEIFGLWS